MSTEFAVLGDAGVLGDLQKIFCIFKSSSPKNSVSFGLLFPDFGNVNVLMLMTSGTSD